MDSHTHHLPETDSTLSGLRFPSYPHGADSPKAVICTGEVLRIEEGEVGPIVVVRCADVGMQPHETPNPDLRNGIAKIESPWFFKNEQEAREAYFRMVDHDLRECLVQQKAIEKRVNRIKAERNAAAQGFEDKN